MTKPKENKDKIKTGIHDYIKAYTWKDFVSDIIFLAAIISMFVFCIHPVVGTSMYPTYDDGQYSFCTRIKGNLEQGDVVIAYEESFDELIIKRIAAVEGDEILLSTDGNMYVNGEEYEYGVGDLYLSWYIYSEEFTINEDGSLSLTVGENEYFLVGDNHENSSDSRYFGTFNKNEIRQKVLFVFG